MSDVRELKRLMAELERKEALGLDCSYECDRILELTEHTRGQSFKGLFWDGGRPITAVERALCEKQQLADRLDWLTRAIHGKAEIGADNEAEYIEFMSIYERLMKDDISPDYGVGFTPKLGRFNRG